MAKEDKKLDMTLKLEVKGKEGLDVTLNYKGTTLETVKAVENAIMQALAGLNDAS